jgi:hypothetical protein
VDSSRSASTRQGPSNKGSDQGNQKRAAGSLGDVSFKYSTFLSAEESIEEVLKGDEECVQVQAGISNVRDRACAESSTISAKMPGALCNPTDVKDQQSQSSIREHTSPFDASKCSVAHWGKKLPEGLGQQVVILQSGAWSYENKQGNTASGLNSRMSMSGAEAANSTCNPMPSPAARGTKCSSHGMQAQIAVARDQADNCNQQARLPDDFIDKTGVFLPHISNQHVRSPELKCCDQEQTLCLCVSCLNATMEAVECFLSPSTY